MHFVKAGFRTVSLHHLILLEDGAEEPEPKAIPSDVVRATTTCGRVLDFRGEAAELIRRHVGLVTVTSPDVRSSPPNLPIPVPAGAGSDQGDIPSHDV